jgi:hypothetical protein
MRRPVTNLTVFGAVLRMFAFGAALEVLIRGSASMAPTAFVLIDRDLLRCFHYIVVVTIELSVTKATKS